MCGLRAILQVETITLLYKSQLLGLILTTPNPKFKLRVACHFYYTLHV